MTLARSGYRTWATVLVAVIAAACGSDGGTSTTSTLGVAASPNVVSSQVLGSSEPIECQAADDPGTESLTIGLLDLRLPGWWATVNVTAPAQDNTTLEALLAEAVTSPQTAIKKAALADAGGDLIAGTLGQVLVEAGEFEAGGCVLAAASATAAVTPSADDAGFRVTYLAYKAGEAYELADLSDAAADWYGTAALNPGNDPGAQFYADRAADRLP